MGTAERRAKIVRILCRRGHETISNLAEEFGVSTRTIQRDIEVLSLTEPIYTRSGRYDGGVYVTDNFDIWRMYMTRQEISVLKKLELFAENRADCILNDEELFILKRIISLYTNPKKERKKYNE